MSNIFGGDVKSKFGLRIYKFNDYPSINGGNANQIIIK